MAAPLLLGWFGEQMNLQILKGGVFGPHHFQMFNPDGVTPVDLTGASFEASIFRDGVSYPMSVTIVDAALGKYDLFMSDDDTLLIETVECGRYGWNLKMIDAADNTLQLYYGSVTVMGE